MLIKTRGSGEPKLEMSANPNSAIVKCSHCNTILSSENFEAHKCNLELKECKRIEVIYFCDDSYKNKKLMTGWGTDGVLYTFEVVPRKPIPIAIPLSRRNVTGFREDNGTDEEVPVPASPLPLFATQTTKQIVYPLPLPKIYQTYSKLVFVKKP